MANDIRTAFSEAVERLERDAKAAKKPISRLCEEAGGSPATFYRWKRETPKTIALLGAMQDIVRGDSPAPESTPEAPAP